MRFQIFILKLPRPVDVLFKFSQKIIIFPLLELDEWLVLQRSFKVHHCIAHKLLHLKRIEVFLVRNDVSCRLPDIFYLPELDSQHLIVFIKVLLQIVVSHASGELIKDGLKSSVELRLKSGNHLVVFAVSLGIPI